MRLHLWLLPALTVALGGCAIAPYQPGFLYTGTKMPADVRDNAVACTRYGQSSSTNVLGLISVGDASTAAAKKAGGITRVGTVDTKFTSFLGLFSTSTTEVCGE
nr:TRL-like family protein [Oceanococcus sp. HetDA_MAG_MS8]